MPSRGFKKIRLDVSSESSAKISSMFQVNPLPSRGFT